MRAELRVRGAVERIDRHDALAAPVCRRAGSFARIEQRHQLARRLRHRCGCRRSASRARAPRAPCRPSSVAIAAIAACGLSSPVTFGKQLRRFFERGDRRIRIRLRPAPRRAPSAPRSCRDCAAASAFTWSTGMSSFKSLGRLQRAAQRRVALLERADRSPSAARRCRCRAPS